MPPCGLVEKVHASTLGSSDGAQGAHTDTKKVCSVPESRQASIAKIMERGMVTMKAARHTCQDTPVCTPVAGVRRPLLTVPLTL